MNIHTEESFLCAMSINKVENVWGKCMQVYISG